MVTNSHIHTAVTGSNGFVGSAIVKQLINKGMPVKALFHNNVNDNAQHSVIHKIDVTNPSSLKGMFDGIDVLVHSSTYIGDDEEKAFQINAEGTQNVINEAYQAGVRRIIYMSNCAVYGGQSHSGIREDEANYEPRSQTSKSKLEAELSILEYSGGVVLRPMFTYGTGDRWFIPGLAKLCQAQLFPIENGKAKLSVISIDELANVTLEAICSDNDIQGVYHVAEEAIEANRLAKCLATLMGISKNNKFTPFEEAYQIMKKYGATRHQLELIALDHYYNCDRAKETFSWYPNSKIEESLSKYKDWYLKVLKEGK